MITDSDADDVDDAGVDVDEELDGDPFDAEPADEQPAGPQYPNADAWLRGWLLNVWQPTIPPGANDTFQSNAPPPTHWCPRWWLHPEAVVRIEALWRTWEDAQPDAYRGMALWFRDQFDHHWPRLVGTPGPFMYCTNDTHRAPMQLRAIPVGVHLADDGTESEDNTDQQT
ncbi:hypothetical protein CGZ98_06150 [Enemella evansiae]|uniref:DUF4913 domain-containing protein n=1 Tax=Enemella evansiae TaxID=2016499 RepID=UPI000B97652C|nr:DUF4913 domain-containing protein [Enemella evansiae]OYO13124.1 hypothetical protein CGZ98_06150 [Enemella evansiae]